MEKQACKYSSFPRDLTYEILFLLEASDVCSLGSCSRFWREICDSDCLWEFLYEERWPELASLHEESLASPGESHCPEFDEEKDGRLKKGWKEIYSKRYTEIAREVFSMQKRLAGEYIDIDDYFKVIEDMENMQLGFKDVQIHFLKSNTNVLFNLAGLHYCIKHLNSPVEDMAEAIIAGQIQHRPVYIECRMRGWTCACCSLSLEAVTATERGNEALDLLEIGLNDDEGMEVRVSSTRSVGSVMIYCDSRHGYKSTL